MMAEKIPFVSKEKLEEIASQYATPFYLYDEKGIRETARRVNKAFSWNKGFKEYFAVKATPGYADAGHFKNSARRRLRRGLLVLHRADYG